MTRHQRFDFATIRSKPTRTPQGFLRIDANLTRIGVLLYRNEDGSVRRELRLPDEVFNKDSMQTLGLVPVTDMHPKEGLVGPENVGDLRRGVVAETVKHDDRYLQASVIVENADLIEKVEKGERRELSPGYTCHLDETPGEWKGEKYDAIQRGIIYNHLAVGPKGWGRSGSEVALKMDSGLVSYEAKVTTDPTHKTIANIPERSMAVGSFVRAALAGMNKSTGHVAETLGVDVWAVESFLDGFWDSIEQNRRILADPDGSSPRTPDTGIARREQFAEVAKFIDVDTETLFALVPVAERADGHSNPQRKQRTDAMEMEDIEFEGIKFQVPKAIAGAVNAAITAMKEKAAAALADAGTAKEKMEEAKTDAAKANARADTADTAKAALQAKLDAAVSPETISALVKSRVALENIGRRIIGDGATFDGKSDKDVKIAVIKHIDEKFDPAGKSDDYLQARFDATVANLSEDQSRTDHNASVARAAAEARSSSPPDAEKSRADAAERSRNDWKKPTTFSKQVTQ